VADEIYGVQRFCVARARRATTNISDGVLGLVGQKDRNAGAHPRVIGLAYADAVDIGYEIARTRHYHGRQRYRFIWAPKREHPCICYVASLLSLL
jgi:hypothetical protein